MNDEVISEETPLIDLGVDSLVAVEIRTWFSTELGMDVAVLKILGGSSIRELIDDTISKLASTLLGESSKATTHDDENTGTARSDDSSLDSSNLKASSQSSVTGPEDPIKMEGSIGT